MCYSLTQHYIPYHKFSRQPERPVYYHFPNDGRRQNIRSLPLFCPTCGEESILQDLSRIDPSRTIWWDIFIPTQPFIAHLAVWPLKIPPTTKPIPLFQPASYSQVSIIREVVSSAWDVKPQPLLLALEKSPQLNFFCSCRQLQIAPPCISLYSWNFLSSRSFYPFQ